MGHTYLPLGRLHTQNAQRAQICRCVRTQTHKRQENAPETNAKVEQWGVSNCNRDTFLLELTGAREIVLVKIGTDFNAADLFTKVLAVEKFDTFTAYVLGER